MSTHPLKIKDLLAYQKFNTYVSIKTEDNYVFNGIVEDALTEEKYLDLIVHNIYPLYFADLERMYIVYETENLINS